jgi:hypothetical protein
MAQTIATSTRPAYHAYQLLYLGFIVAPLVAGLDKFTHFLTDWDMYLAPVVAGLLRVDYVFAVARFTPLDGHEGSHAMPPRTPRGEHLILAAVASSRLGVRSSTRRRGEWPAAANPDGWTPSPQRDAAARAM